jgi:ABC-type polysaccharide/polyol phosphate export permease
VVGFLWGFIKPLIYLLIFIVIFSKGFPNLQNYVLFATSGLILWFFFSNLTSQSVGNIVSSTGLIKSLNIPSIYFPLSEMLSELFNLVLTLAVFLVIMNWFHLEYSFRLFLIIPCVILFALFAFGLSLFLCSLNVFFRDVGIIWATIQPAVFYLTPIAYPENAIPENYKLVIQLNPIYYFIKLGRKIFCDPVAPPLNLWLQCITLSFVTYIVGQFVFNKLKNQFISAI